MTVHLLYVSIFLLCFGKVYPGNDDYIRGNDGFYYKYHNSSMNWSNAKRTCESEGAHLPIIESLKTFDYIKKDFRQDRQGIWLGVEYDKTSDSWRWLNGVAMSNDYWQPGEPNNYGGHQEDCVIMNYLRLGAFFDVGCGWKEPKVLCQRGNVSSSNIVIPHKICPKEHGFCVRHDGGDQNSGVIKLNSHDQKSASQQADCLRRCQGRSDATGCEVIWDQGNRGCYVHTGEVARGNGAHRHFCWVFSKCKGVTLLPSTTGPIQTAKPTQHPVVAGKVGYRKVGCYAEHVGMKLLATDRDLSHEKSTGKMLDWFKFKDDILSLAERCAKTADSAGFKYFSLRYYAECWGGDTFETNPTARARTCIDGMFAACDDNEEGECVGTNQTEYLYEVARS